MKYCLIHTRTATVVRSEDDSGLDTLWLLKKMAFLSKRGKNKTKQKTLITSFSHADHKVAAMRSWLRLP